MPSSKTKHNDHDHSKMGHDEHTMADTHADHKSHATTTQSHHDMHAHASHAGHEMGKESGHAGHVDHTGHEDMFRRRFWVSLLLSIPVLLYTPMLQMWFGIQLSLIHI